MRRYIQGHRRGRDANRIEREAMRDPFLAEALEGYERAKGDPVPHIDILRRKIRSRNQRRLDVFRYGGIAASLIFILGFGIYFGFYNFPPSSSGNMEDTNEAVHDRSFRNRMAKDKLQLPDIADVKPASEPETGFDAYKKYVEEKMIRPADDCKDVKGKVTLGFHVDASGKPFDIKVTQPLCPSIDKEAIRLLKEGSLWKPTDMEVSYAIDF